MTQFLSSMSAMLYGTEAGDLCDCEDECKGHVIPQPATCVTVLLDHRDLLELEHTARTGKTDRCGRKIFRAILDRARGASR